MVARRKYDFGAGRFILASLRGIKELLIDVPVEMETSRLLNFGAKTKSKQKTREYLADEWIEGAVPVRTTWLLWRIFSSVVAPKLST